MNHRQCNFTNLLICVLVACAGATGCDSSSPSLGDQRAESDSTTPAAAPSEAQPPVESAAAAAVLPEINGQDEMEVATAAPVVAPQERKLDLPALEKLGIHVYESRHLRLLTDVDPETARGLLPLGDGAYAVLSAYFGDLKAGGAQAVRMTGYVMQDLDRFRRAGLLPEGLPEFEHGRQWETEFWMHDQQFEYYRRHLLIHEFVHCYMWVWMTERGQTDAPLWYVEGMAEHFATHALDPNGQIRYSVMPASPDDFVGLGRIGLVQRDVAAGRLYSLDELIELTGPRFQGNAAYAWSWALAHYLMEHPRYRARFREAVQSARDDFVGSFRRALSADLADLRTEWPLVAQGLQYGYDVKRSAIEFRDGKPFKQPEEVKSCDVAGDRGWQSSGVLVEAGHTYDITATRTFTLAQQPKPWVSDAGGVSIRYFDGRPLGLLLASVREQSPSGDMPHPTMLDDVAIGRQGRFTPPVTGTLYLRLNDSWSELADNTGTVRVEVRESLHP